MAGYLEDPAILRFYFRFRARIAIQCTGTLATEIAKSYAIDELLEPVLLVSEIYLRVPAI